LLGGKTVGFRVATAYLLEDTAWERLRQGGPTIWLKLQGTVDASGTLSYIVEILQGGLFSSSRHLSAEMMMMMKIVFFVLSK
jgi:hypothetical protein